MPPLEENTANQSPAEQPEPLETPHEQPTPPQEPPAEPPVTETLPEPEPATPTVEEPISAPAPPTDPEPESEQLQPPEPAPEKPSSPPPVVDSTNPKPESTPPLVPQHIQKPDLTDKKPAKALKPADSTRNKPALVETAKETGDIPQKVLDLTPEELDAARRLWAREHIADAQKQANENRHARMLERMDEIERIVKAEKESTVHEIATKMRLSEKLTAGYLEKLVDAGRVGATGHTKNRRFIA